MNCLAVHDCGSPCLMKERDREGERTRYNIKTRLWRHIMSHAHTHGKTRLELQNQGENKISKSHLCFI